MQLVNRFNSRVTRSFTKSVLFNSSVRVLHSTAPAASGSNYIILGNEQKLQEIVADNNRSLLYFTASWCPPCKMIAPIFSRMSGEFPNTNFVKIDIDDFPDLAEDYHIRSVPTFIYMKGATKAAEVNLQSPLCFIICQISGLIHFFLTFLSIVLRGERGRFACDVGG